MKKYRFVWTIVLALGIFFVTFEAAMSYIEDASIDVADRKRTVLNKKVVRNFESVLVSVENAAANYLASDFVNRKDTIDGKVINRFFISSESRKEFPIPPKDMMRSFLDANPKVRSVLFVFCSSNLTAGKSGTYAPLMFQESDTITVLSDSIDIMNTKIIKDVLATKKSVWISVKKEYVSFAVPLYLDSGEPFGLFFVDITKDTLKKELIDNLPYGGEQSACYVFDENDRLFLSTYREELYGRTITELRELIDRDLDIDHTKISNCNWQLTTISKTEAIYEGLWQVRVMMWSICSVGMLLMICCCFLIFRQIRGSIQKRAVLENELSLAENVQKKMLPCGKLTVEEGRMAINLEAILRPAKRVGGDLYDYVNTGENIIFIIGDVSGKGLPAALFMTQVCSLFRNAVRGTTEPSEIAAGINDVLALHNDEMTFCTAIIGTLNIKTGRLLYSNAGHNKPVLKSKSKDSSDNVLSFVDMKPNIALALIEEYPYQTEELQLSQGDELIFYTDGVNEAMNVAHECFGDDRLLESIKCGSTIADLLLSLDNYVGKAVQSDDITILKISLR